MIRIGLDVGSTTLKCVVLSEAGEVVYKKYERHFSQISEKSAQMLFEICESFPNEKNVGLCVSGSAGMGFAEQTGIPFVQEVYATRVSVKRLLPETDVVIELGGEDAKILFISGMMEVRMNGTCAGGTGAFIDQMSTLLNITPTEMNELAAQHTKIYSVASRCGVFAKSDIQPLLNQGAQKSDISASIFAAVVNQTIAGLAQGREIGGNVVYLGGPLTFLSELRALFDKALGRSGLCPENSLYYVALGAAMMNNDSLVDLRETVDRIKNYSSSGSFRSCRPLFASEEDYAAFRKRHKSGEAVEYSPLLDGNRAYIGIDAGSTTVKGVVLNENGELVFSKYLRTAETPSR